ncbi:MAG: DUF1616 domain-containing protein, partial [Candidatus Thermoplasmatota archaeon]|nr:DUF1616 domain-containing protein [Candidatus Thermoplasmatota archaeon]
ERFVITIDISFPRNESRLDQALTIILACSIIISLIVLVYVIVIPKTGEQFTEFYLLGPEGIADNYPRDIVIDEPINVIVGIVNHEYKPMNYTIELWLINQTFTYNESSKSNETVYHEMWFLDSIQTTLNHTPIDIEGPWEPQWEYNWMFSVDKKGEYKLCFLLTTDTFNEYDPMINYADIAYEKLRDSYRSTHLWVHVT